MKVNKFTLLLTAFVIIFTVQECISSVTLADSTILPSVDNTRKLNQAMRKLARKEWPLPGATGSLRLNDSTEAVIRLKKYLLATGDLYDVNRRYLFIPVFDEKLEEAVKNFQVRHGLNPDGIAGEYTLQSMNVPVSERLEQIEANIIRMQDLPADWGDRYIVVNIPGYVMEYYDEGRLATRMNVVVGELENYTPTFQDTMSYIVFNPEWNVPVSIAVKEIVPEVKSDPGYLAKHHYVILKGSQDKPDTIPPEDINWDELTEENFPVRIVQLPGKWNSLGRMKFMFPNNYNIYLHDSPSEQLFTYEKRAFSHGCIRLENPMELAEILLSGQMKPDEIKKILDQDKTTSVPLKNKVVVHLIYETAWVDREGRLNFREDIYGLDKQTVSEIKQR
ncbi:MAG TPA: L,D-transpeptidase family protein [Bacteroidales bacterium]|nr:L,D-transpeptidase family protein [Bacteroidales bacterium]